MIRFWGQSKFAPPNGKMIGYELFLREQKPGSSHWQVPHDFSRFTPEVMIGLMARTLPTLPDGLRLISFNLDQEQFVEPAYCRLTAELAKKLPYQLVVELTERRGHGSHPVAIADLEVAAKRFKQAGLTVCLDDVGTGENQQELVASLGPYVNEYKYALQNVRNKLSEAQIEAEIAMWHQAAVANHKFFALEGFEEAADIKLIEQFHPDIVQGYYYGKPHALPIQTDFHY